MKHRVSAAEPLVFEFDVPQAPELVWRALTERELLGAWLAPNDLRPEVGARFRFDNGAKGEPRSEGDVRRDEGRSCGDGDLRRDEGGPRGVGDLRRGQDGRHGHGDHHPGSIDCEVLTVDPGKTLRWRQTEAGDADSGWRSVTSVVTVELTDNVDGGTHLRLEHGEFSIEARATVTVLKRRQTRARKRTETLCQLRWAA